MYYIFILFILVLIYLITNKYENFQVNNPKNVIMTTYFCNKKDPQRLSKAPCNDFKYIKPWYTSVKKLGLNGIIFHDGLSENFIRKYETNKIKFIYKKTHQVFSLNDYRYFIYLDYINEHPEIENIFMTDGNDVTVVNDPFTFIKPRNIYVGSEIKGDKMYVLDKLNNINANKNNNKLKLDTIYNAGILGGNRENVIKFIKKMIYIFNLVDNKNKDKNNNMAVFNITSENTKNIITGAPLHSDFKEFQNNRKDVYFIHK